MNIWLQKYSVRDIFRLQKNPVELSVCVISCFILVRKDEYVLFYSFGFDWIACCDDFSCLCLIILLNFATLPYSLQIDSFK